MKRNHASLDYQTSNLITSRIDDRVRISPQSGSSSLRFIKKLEVNRDTNIWD